MPNASSVQASPTSSQDRAHGDGTGKKTEIQRIVMVSHFFVEHRSGIELVAHQIANRLATHGINTVWASSHIAPETPRLPGNYRRLNMATWNFVEERVGIPYPLWSLPSLKALAREIQNSDLVFIHDCLYFGSVSAFLIAKWYRKKTVILQHIGFVPYRSALLRFLMKTGNTILGRWLLRGSDRCVTVSHEVEAYFRGFVRFKHAPTCIPNGVDTERFVPLSLPERVRLKHSFGLTTDSPTILFVGRFTEKKGLPVLRKMAEHFPRITWLFAGWGIDSPADWKLPNVRCLGSLSQSELISVYQLADLLVLPSRGEGFPLVVQESMACGTPALISTETVSALPEIAPFVFHAEPNPESFIAALSDLLRGLDNLTAKRESVARFARLHWQWETCLQRYLELFQTLNNKSPQDA